MLFWPAQCLSAYDGTLITQRIDALTKLVEISSGARQVERSGSEKALALREEARQYLKLAKNAQSEGRGEEMPWLLDKAAEKMFVAIRAAKPLKKAEEKKLREHEKQRESVDALLKAQQRISREKGLSAEAESIRIQVDGLKSKADALLERGELEGAGILLHQAYMVIKLSLESMRGGETLVRTLKFDSEEDEYHYELDRNDTHFMLIKVLAEEKREQGALGKMAQSLFTKAEELRKQAESNAAKKNFAEAIDLLEESTKQLVRVIRSSGIYIPG